MADTAVAEVASQLPISSPHHGNETPWRDREKMFRVYVLTGSVSEVERQTGYSHPTVEKYREIDEWDSRAATARSQARQKADFKLVDSLAVSLNYCRNVKSLLGTRLKGIADKIKEGRELPAELLELNLQNIVDILEQVTRLESFASGGASDRIEVDTAEYNRQMTERREMRVAEYRILEAKAKALSKRNANGNGNGDADKPAE